MKCITKYCQSEGDYARGLCRLCYCRLKQRVIRKSATWGELIALGLAKRAKKKTASRAVRRKAALAAIRERKAAAAEGCLLCDNAETKQESQGDVVV